MSGSHQAQTAFIQKLLNVEFKNKDVLPIITTAIVPEKMGGSLLQMRALEMMLGNTNQRVLHP